MTLPLDVIQNTSKWMGLFRSDWHEEVPLRIHTHEFSDDGTYKFAPEFEVWLGIRSDNERKYRMKRAMRKLRAKSVREFEVAYRMIVCGESLHQTCDWLNARAIRNDKPERYTLESTRVIIVSAVDKLIAWF